MGPNKKLSLHFSNNFREITKTLSQDLKLRDLYERKHKNFANE